MKTLQAFGHIEHGSLEIYNRNVFAQAIKEIGFVNHFIMTIEYGNKRTIDQNSYLFGGVINPILVRYQQEGWDYTALQVYRILEDAFSRKEVVNSVTGEIATIIEPLKELTTDEWDEIVMNRIRHFAKEDLGIYIKLPHEYYGMREEAYTKWKSGEIDFKEAKSKSKNPLTDAA